MGKYFGKQFKSSMKEVFARLGKSSFGEQKSMGKFILEKYHFRNIDLDEVNHYRKSAGA